MKRLICFLLILVVCFSLTGCMSKEEYTDSVIAELEEEKALLESEVLALEGIKEILNRDITELKVDNGTAKYIVTYKIAQSHFSLDLGDHLKDAMNAITIQIPVDKEYYDSIEVGQSIDDSFRMGSFILYGSFGSWDITIEDKEIV